jgi:predicted permease
LKALIVAQVATSLLLVVGAGLLARSLYNLRRLDAGFNSESLLVLRIDIGQARYQGAAAENFYREIVSRTQSLPGVITATVAANDVFGSGGWAKAVWVEGRPAEENQTAAFNVVGPGFFATTRIPVLLGREFADQDALGTPKVIIVNEAFARRFLPGLNPIGHHVSDPAAKYEIIGVVKDAKYRTLREQVQPMVYEPLFQEDHATGVSLHVRTHGNPIPLVAGIREQIRSVNSALFVHDARTLSEVVARSLQRDQMMAVLASFFGLLAMLLTCIGLYGVIAFAVARRTKEVGVRIALGARRPELLWLVLRETLVLVAAGALLGIPAALGFSRVLRNMLFGLQPNDLATMAGAVLVLLVVGSIAGYLPARRAAKVDPIAVLRCE